MHGTQLGHLVKMANQIAVNCGEHRDPGAAARRTAEHLHKFWTPAMRAQLADYAAGGGEDLSPAVRLIFTAESELSGRPQ